ncbi:MAG TPA: ATP-binding protein, partial [Myxococcales bacterium]|nr:ATP-binding protein [Myxococcales bacterium]
MADIHTFLELRNFAQIRHARIEFGDVTVLVGPQATGKSLILQLFKMLVDVERITWRLDNAGLQWKGLKHLYDLYLGEGMGQAWRNGSGYSVQIPARPGDKRSKLHLRSESVFYVPAQRALVLAEGWPLRFELTNERTPFVARFFCDQLYRLFSSQRRPDFFPDRTRLSPTLNRLIDQALLHGGRIGLRKWGSSRKLELLLRDGADGIQFPAWSTGQREFTPLLLGLYCVLP